MSKKVLLIIDDSKVFRLMLTDYLKDTYETFEAENGIDALEKVKEIQKNNKKISAIICDIHMPQMDGPEFITLLKEQDKNRFTPVIVISCEKPDHYRFKFMHNAWLEKPVKREELLDILEKVLNPIDYLRKKYSPAPSDNT